MIGLLDALEDHGDSIEADFQRYYRIYLGDLFTGKLTWRRFKVLYSRLPQNSQTSIAINGRAALWTDVEELLASICEVLAWANWQRGGGKGAKPKSIDRPYNESKPKTMEEAKASVQAKAENDKDALTQEEFDRIMFDV